MKPNNEMKLSFPSRSANEGFARAAVAAFVAQLDPAVDELAAVSYTHLDVYKRQSLASTTLANTSGSTDSSTRRNRGSLSVCCGIGGRILSTV